jgi:hypothetical protein
MHCVETHEVHKVYLHYDVVECIAYSQFTVSLPMHLAVLAMPLPHARHANGHSVVTHSFHCDCLICPLLIRSQLYGYSPPNSTQLDNGEQDLRGFDTSDRYFQSLHTLHRATVFCINHLVSLLAVTAAVLQYYTPMYHV